MKLLLSSSHLASSEEPFQVVKRIEIEIKVKTHTHYFVDRLVVCVCGQELFLYGKSTESTASSE